MGAGARITRSVAVATALFLGGMALFGPARQMPPVMVALAGVMFALACAAVLVAFELMKGDGK